MEKKFPFSPISSHGGLEIWNMLFWPGDPGNSSAQSSYRRKRGRFYCWVFRNNRVEIVEVSGK